MAASTQTARYAERLADRHAARAKRLAREGVAECYERPTGPAALTYYFGEHAEPKRTPPHGFISPRPSPEIKYYQTPQILVSQRTEPAGHITRMLARQQARENTHTHTESTKEMLRVRFCACCSQAPVTGYRQVCKRGSQLSALRHFFRTNEAVNSNTGCTSSSFLSRPGQTKGKTASKRRHIGRYLPVDGVSPSRAGW